MEFPFNRPMWADDSYRASFGGRRRSSRPPQGGHFRVRLAKFSPQAPYSACQRENVRMANVWLASAVWIGLALLASIISIRVAVSVALIEIVVGAIAGNRDRS